MHRGAENNLLGSLRLLLFFFAQKRMLVKGAPFGCMLRTAQKRMLVKGAPFGCMLLTALQSQTSGAWFFFLFFGFFFFVFSLSAYVCVAWLQMALRWLSWPRHWPKHDGRPRGVYLLGCKVPAHVVSMQR